MLLILRVSIFACSVLFEDFPWLAQGWLRSAPTYERKLDVANNPAAPPLRAFAMCFPWIKTYELIVSVSLTCSKHSLMEIPLLLV
jgi:hypothetical protein